MEGGDGGQTGEGLADEASTLEIELENMGRGLGIERERVLFYKCLGKLMRVSGEMIIEKLYNLESLVGFFERLAHTTYQ